MKRWKLEKPSREWIEREGKDVLTDKLFTIKIYDFYGRWMKKAKFNAAEAIDLLTDEWKFRITLFEDEESLNEYIASCDAIESKGLVYDTLANG